MGKPHPIELRERVVALVKAGHSHRSAAITIVWVLTLAVTLLFCLVTQDFAGAAIF